MKSSIYRGNEIRRLNALLSPGAAFRTGFSIRFSPISLRKTMERLIFEEVIRQDSSVYDPFCGNGTILYGLAVYFPGMFSMMYGSDISKELVETTDENLQLTAPKNLEAALAQLTQEAGNASDPLKMQKICKRVDNLERLLNVYEKHNDNYTATPFLTFQANVLTEGFTSQYIHPKSVDYVICDPPYGNHCPSYDEKGDISITPLDLGKAFMNMLQALAPKAKAIIFLDKRLSPHIDNLNLVASYPIGGRHTSRITHIFEVA